MKSLTSWLKIAAVAACLLTPSFAAAQFSVEPQNGGLVRLDKENFWNVKSADDIQVSAPVKLADGLRTPTISPDGSHIILAKRPFQEGEPSQLYQWTDNKLELDLILEDDEASDFVTWTDNQRFFVRQKSAPFFKDGKKLNFHVENKRALFRSLRPINENPVIVYDSNDVIVMKRNNTVQAISDVTVDRYYGPHTSADENYIVFSGLTTGINLFDIAQNAVVYQDAYGTDPVFTADSKYLVYAETHDDGHVITQGDIIVIDLNSKTKRRIANPNHEIRVRASLSNDAKFIAYETINQESFKAKLNQ